MNAADRTDLVRCWFEFDVADLAWPTRLGTVTLDGGTLAYRMLGRGAGVTGYDVDDCLSLVGRAIAPEPLPPVVRTVTDVDWTNSSYPARQSVSPCGAASGSRP